MKKLIHANISGGEVRGADRGLSGNVSRKDPDRSAVGCHSLRCQWRFKKGQKPTGVHVFLNNVGLVALQDDNSSSIVTLARSASTEHCIKVHPVARDEIANIGRNIFF
jgi:hypothetical protein